MATFTVTTFPTHKRIVQKGQTFKAFHFKFEDANAFSSEPDLADDFSEPGVYLLIRDVEGEKPKVYVGEAEPTDKRIKQHVSNRNKGKEFPWTEGVLFVNTSNEWVKADIKYIENGLYELLKKSAHYDCENASTPTKSKVADESTLIQHIEAIKNLALYYGHPKLFASSTATTSVPPTTTPPTASSKPTLSDKVGVIAQYYFPKVFASGTLSNADITYLCSPLAKKDFKTRGNTVLKEYHGNPNEYFDTKKRRRFYSIAPLQFAGKQYMLTSQLFPASKNNVVAWLNSHGANIL